MSSLKSLIPPKIASARAMTASPDAVSAAYWAAFYSRMPKGRLPEARMPPPSSPLRRWYFKHFTEGRETITPWVQMTVGLIITGYLLHRVNHKKMHEIELAQGGGH